MIGLSVESEAEAMFLRAGDLIRHPQNIFVLVFEVVPSKSAKWHVIGWNCKHHKKVRFNIFVCSSIIRDGEERTWESIKEEYWAALGTSDL